MAKATRSAKAKAAKPATAVVTGATDDLGPAGNVAGNAVGAAGDGVGGASAVATATNSLDTPRGSSGTAREASSTGGGTTAETPSVGAQPGSPNGSIETEEEAQATWPLFFAASQAWKAAHPGTLPTVVRIMSKRDGFRRAGMAHSKASVDHPIGTFDADQLELLLGEPNLTVTFA